MLFVKICESILYWMLIGGYYNSNKTQHTRYAPYFQTYVLLQKMDSLDTNKPQGFRFCTTNQSCEAQDRPPHITRFTYRLDNYNSLDEFYLHHEQTRIQDGLEGTREDSGSFVQSMRGFSQIKTNVIKKPHIFAGLQSQKPSTRVGEEDYQAIDEKRSAKEKELSFGWKIRERKQRKNSFKGREQRLVVEQIYQQEEESHNSFRKKAKIQHSNSDIRQASQNLHQKYEIQSVPNWANQQAINVLKHQQPRGKDHNRTYKNPLFLNQRQESEQSLFKKGNLGNKRQQINMRYQSPEDVTEKENAAQRYLQLMQQEINATLTGQNVENFVRHWISKYCRSQDRRLEGGLADSKQESQSQWKGPKESQKDQSNLEKQKREHSIKHERRSELPEHESNVIMVDPLLQVPESSEYRLAHLDAIFNYDASEYCFRDDQEEQQQLELNQFLLH